MVEVVIIGQNEGAFAKKICESIPDEWRIVYVADRCSDNTCEVLSAFKNVHCVKTDHLNLEGRQTSFCRNLGLYNTSDESDVLFLDGDRYIVKGDIRKEIEENNSDIMLLRLEDDFRTNESFFRSYGHIYNQFFSCGIFMSRQSIECAKRFQNGQLFCEDLQSEWGVEDTYLGDVCYHLGIEARLNENISLHGSFDKNELDSIATMERRFRYRENLSVKW